MTNAPCSGPLLTRGCLPGCLSHAGVDVEPARPCCLPPSHWGSGEGGSDPSSPPPHQPGLPPAFSAEKSRLRPSEDAVRPSPASFCPHSGCHLVRVGMGRDGSRMEAGGGGGRGAGREGGCCPQPAVRATGAVGASGCSALLGGGRTWSRSWAISRQTLWGGCQGVSSSER